MTVVPSVLLRGCMAGLKCVSMWLLVLIRNPLKPYRTCLGKVVLGLASYVHSGRRLVLPILTPLVTGKAMLQCAA